MTATHPEHPSEPCDNTSCWAYKERYCHASCKPVSHSSSPAAAPVPDYTEHWRDLFIGDVVSELRWDAEHGNPSLFDAIRILEKHRTTFSIEQHHEQIRREAAAKERVAVFEEVLTTLNAYYEEKDADRTVSIEYWDGAVSALDVAIQKVELLRGEQPEQQAGERR